MKRFLATLVILFSLTLPTSASNVGSLSTMGAPADATYTFLTNPGNYFSIVGTEIVANPSTPSGQYSIVVQATGGGLARPVKRTFALNYTSAIPPPVPGVFSVGINLVGGEAQFPNFATTAQINYHANRLHGSLNPVPKFRLTLGWSRPNNVSPFNAPPLNGVVGIQPVAFGPLDTTSTAYGGLSYVGAMNRVISDAMAAGGQVLLDIHTFGFNFSYGQVGSAGCPYSCFADLWGKIADYYVHVRPDLLPGIYGFDLMNEWEFIDSSIAFNGNQAAITASRANGYTGPIYVEGVNFSSAWNWTSGETQSFNNSNLYQLVDPLNNLISSAHMYPDPDDSGSQATSFSYSVSLGIPGSAPTGLNLNPTIGVTRVAREWQLWLALHGLRGHLGEYGSSNDNPWRQGLFDSASWNVITRNLLTYLKANNIEISLWASGNGPAGYGPNGYGYSLDPFNVDLSGNYDFTATGVQEPIWTVLDDFTGYAGAQPTAYALFQPGLTTPALYIPVSTASQPFTVYYGGKITSPVTITPHDTLADFTTGAGGTFTPATITLAAGDNALATFTYTPSQATTIAISTTNSAGWSDPPRIGISSTTDNFATLPNTSNICDLRRVKTNYIGPAVREIAADGVSQQDFYFNNRGDLPRQALYDYASSTTPKIVRIYSQNGNPASNCVSITAPSSPAFALVPSVVNPPLLNLNPTGYPEVSAASGQWMGTQAASNGKGLLTLVSRVNGTSVFLSQSNFNTQFRMATTSGFDVAPNGPDNFLSFGALSGYNSLAGTYSNLYGTNNQKAYVNGSAVAQGSPGQFTFNAAAADTFINGFRFGGQNFTGAWTSQIITFDEASAGTISSFNSDDVAYYSTPLPDPFVTGNLPPVVSNTPAAQTTVLAHFFPPFGMGPNGATNTGTVVTDPNPGGTDSAVITITGDAGATITGAGITGSNPYNIASTTPAALTSILQLLQYQSSSSVGTVGTVSLVVTSSSTHFATVTTTVTVGAVVAETPFAAPAGCTFTPPTYAKGVNISDASGHYPAQPPAQNRFSYIYPQTFEVSYFASQGLTAIRLPVTAPRLQPWAYRPMDPTAITRTDGFVGRVDEQAVNAFAALGTQTNLTAIKAVVDQACSLNMYVLLEPHDFGVIFDNRINTTRAIGVDAEGTAMFRDWWVRFATLWENAPNVIFQEENEPAAQSASQWQAAAALVTSDIAAVTTSHTVMLQGVGFDSCLGWTSNGNSAAWTGYTPPAGLPIVFECHQYLDSGASGTSPVCAGTGSSRLTTFTNWLVANSFKGYVGEFGWSSQSSCMTSATTGDGPTFLSFLSANEPLYFGWAWWLGGSSAFEGTWQAPAAALASTVVPVGYPSGPFTPAPQLQTLINNLP